MVEVVNVIGSGSLGLELDLDQLAVDLGSCAEYDPKKYPGVYLRIDEEAPLIIFYRTGKYITTGATSEEETRGARKQFLQLLYDTGVLEKPRDEWFQIQNYVCTGETGRELNLNALAIGLGLENTEYEPEQFPGQIYRPPEMPCVVLLFASGRVVITGSPDLESAEKVFEQVDSRVRELQGEN